MSNQLAIPAELKPITPFCRRAEELDKDKARPESRLVAYYCRQYAVHQGIPLASSSTNPAVKETLGLLLEQLETEKAAMDQFTRPEAEYLCRQFAYQVFDKADSEDRQGAATKTTAKTFYTSASFLQMLEQFYPQGEDAGEPSKEQAEDKKRALYAKWKATEILKAIKEGRTPQAGGYGEQQEEENEEGEEEQGSDEIKTENNNDKTPPTETNNEPEQMQIDNDEAAEKESVLPTLPPPPAPFPEEPKDEVEEEGQEVPFAEEDDDEPTLPPPAYPGPSDDKPPASAPPPSRPPMSFDIPPAVPPPFPPKATTPAPAPAPAPKKAGWFGGGNKNKAAASASKAQLADATELTKFALSALEDKNGELAAERLQQALDILRNK